MDLVSLQHSLHEFGLLKGDCHAIMSYVKSKKECDLVMDYIAENPKDNPNKGAEMYCLLSEFAASKGTIMQSRAIARGEHDGEARIKGEKCNKCGSTNTSIEIVQFRSGDEAADTVLRCISCRHKQKM
jgi:DNA-directed RNA polymerase subunit M/transcription elongation factor TFIIS